MKIAASFVQDGSLRSEYYYWLTESRNFQTNCLIVLEISPSMKLQRSKKIDKRGREAYIQKLTSFEYFNTRYIAAARRGGSIQIYKCNSVNETNLVFVYGNNLHVSVDPEDSFVSLIYRDQCLHSCSCLGKVVIQSLNPILNHQHHINNIGSLNYLSLSVSSPVSCLTLHPSHKWVSISGGKDREVEINDFYALAHMWKSKHSSLLEDLYLDEDLDEIKWIQDLLIIESSVIAVRSMKLVIASKFGKLMLFDTARSMYPLSVIEIPVTKMFQLDSDYILTFDSFDNVNLVDLESFQIIQTWDNITTGSMCSIEVFRESHDTFLIIASQGSIKIYNIHQEENTNHVITPLSRFNFPKKSIIPAITAF